MWPILVECGSASSEIKWQKTKFLFTLFAAFRAAVGTRVPIGPLGTLVVNYSDIFILSDGYPSTEYIKCHIYLIGFSELVQ